MTEYFTSDLEHRISKDTLRGTDRETQLDVMETWFRQRFEDPAERTPYETAKDGYIWIWDGPYDAREELETEFAGVVPDEVINKLVGKLERECWQWAPTPSADDYDDYLAEDIARITECYDNFCGAIVDIQELLETKVDDSVSNCFRRLLYVNVIIALETYSSDVFINTVVNNPALMRRFIETTPEFKTEKVPLSEVFKAVEGIEQKAGRYLINVVWHRLDRVKPMYHATLGIEFPPDSRAIFRAISTRHDIVHRNGKKKDGTEIFITPTNVHRLIATVVEFVKHIDTQLANVRSNNQLNTNTPPPGGAGG